MINKIKIARKDLTSSKDLSIGQGYLSGYLSLFLGISAFAGVISIMYPNIFTTPELRESYYIDFIRNLIHYFLILSLLLGLLSFIYYKKRIASSTGIIFGLIAILLGGSNVVIGNSGGVLYVGLDWFILSLLTYGVIFIVLEKIFPLRKTQGILRDEWFLDMKYYFFNHLFGGIVLILINYIIQNYLNFLIWNDLQSYINSISIFLQVIFIFLITDFLQYWIHRAYHQIPFLWKIHAVHHSAPKMDWLAGSRLHILELAITRSSILIAVVLIGFSESAVNIYIVIVGFWATFIHLNMNVKIPYLDKVFVGPKFHHWHHSKSKEAIDKNFAGQLAFYDILFGTALYKKDYPKSYGIVSPKNFPKTFRAQTFYPFKK